MVVFQVSHAVLDVSRGIIVVIDRENRVVVIRMDAVGSRRLQGDGRGDVPLRAHFHANALLVDVGHDEIDELAGVGVGTGGGVLEHVFAIETAVPNEVSVSVVVTRQAELELGRAIEVAQIHSQNALALEVAFHDGVSGARRHINVPELRGLGH